MSIFKPGTVNPTAPNPVDPTNPDIPWMAWMKQRDGWTEFNHDTELSKYWKYSGMPEYKTVIGRDYAWCALTINGALHDVGLKGNNRPDAASFNTFGDSCGYIYGAILPIVHPNGSHHVTCFDHWVDKGAKIAACRGGNQGNSLNVTNFNLSGGTHDKVMSGGPRWPKGYPQGA